jgi:hypothetical protein
MRTAMLFDTAGIISDSMRAQDPVMVPITIDDPDIVRSVSPGLKRLRSHQNALRAPEAITGVTSLERAPASILYNTIPCANAMLAITPIRKRRFHMALCIRILSSARASRAAKATRLIDARIDLCLQRAGT